MISVYRLKYRKQDLEQIPVEEKVIYFMFGEAANCISALSKQTLFWLQAKEGQGEAHTYARTSAALANVKLLAGTLYETWKVIEGPQHSRLYPAYREFLGDDANRALVSIKKYFNYSNNLIKGLRLKLAFHNDYETAAAAFEAFPIDTDLADFIGEYTGNMFYNGAHVMTAFAMLHLLGESDLERGLITTSEEVMGISNLVERYLHGFCGAFAQKHLEALHAFSGIPSFEVDDAPNISDVHLPYFIRR